MTTTAAQPHRTVQGGHPNRDGTKPVDPGTAQRPKPNSVDRPSRPAVEPHAGGATRHNPTCPPRVAAAWRQANGRSPDTHLAGHGGEFNNGDRKRVPVQKLNRLS